MSSEDRSEAARTLGQVRTERKAESSRANLERANAARTIKPCDCGRIDGTHHHTCPEYRRQAVAKYRAK